MKKTLLTGAATAVALLLSACGTNKEAAENNMAAVNDMSAMTADPNNPFAQAEAQMHERMMAAVGSNPSETWIRKMIEHHRGAVAMSDIVLAQNPTPEVRAEAEKARTHHLGQISSFEAILSGEDTIAAAPAAAPPAAQTSSAPAAEPRPTTGERTAAGPAPQRAPKPAPEPEPDPHAGHDMNNMQ